MAPHGRASGSDDGMLGGRTVWAVAALLAVMLVVTVAGFGYAVWREYHNAIAQTEERAANAVRTAEEHVHWLVEASMQALNRVDDALAANPGAVAAGEVGDLKAFVGSLPIDTSIWVFDAEGNAVLKTDPRDIRVNIADRPYFAVHEAGADWRINPLTTGRIGGRKVFTISRRIERGGQFAGVAVVVIPADLMSEFYATLDLGPRSSVSLIRDDGWIVARHPQLSESLDLSGHPLFTEHLPAAPTGLYHSVVSPADGEARIVAYRRIQDLPLVSVVGVSRTAALEGFWTRLRVLGALGAGALVAMLLLSAWLVALLRRDERNRQQLRRSLAQNELLLREVHHRVKNNLQIVCSLIRLQPGTPEAKIEMTRRIEAMAAVHEQIYGADQFSAIDLPAYVQVVCDGLVRAFGKPVRMRYALAPLKAHIDTALPLGLIISEVVSNALKHAFPDGRQGAIDVTLDHGAAGEVVLRVSDDGVGFDPAAPSSGLGMRLVRALSMQIAGSYRFGTDGGTAFILTFPLDAETRPAGRTVAGPVMAPPAEATTA